MQTSYAFSDGSPFYELSVAVALFVLCLALAKFPPIGRAIDRGLGSLASFLRRRGLLAVDDPFVEQRRVDLVRILFGTIYCWSAWRDFLGAIASDDSRFVGLQATNLSLSALILVGLFTPVSALVLAFLLNLILDNLSGSSNLGSMVAATVATALAFVPAGRSLSVDAWLLRRGGPAGGVVRRLYGAWGPLTTERATIVKGAAFLAFAAISLHSALLHLRDPAWTSGYVNTWLLLSRRTNPGYFEQIQAVYALSPVLYIIISRLSTWATLLWEVAMLPLALLGRWPRMFVVVWGFFFFVAAVVVLRLRLLGWFEGALWVLLFWKCWKLNVDGRDRVVVQATVRASGIIELVRVVDLFGVIEVAEPPGRMARPTPPDKHAPAGPCSLIGVDRDGRARTGYDVLILLSWRILLLLPLWPLLVLGRLGGIGPRLYRMWLNRAWAPGSDARAADRMADAEAVSGRGPVPISVRHGEVPARSSEMRPASVGRSPDGDRPTDLSSAPGGAAVVRAFVLSLFILVVAFAVRLPSVSEQPGLRDAAALSNRLIGSAPLVFGIGPVDVFNGIHLKTMRLSYYGWWTDGTNRFEDLQAMLPHISTTDTYVNLGFLVRMVENRQLCGDPDYRQYIAGIGKKYAPLAIPAGHNGPLLYHVLHLYYDLPLESELRAYQYVSLRDVVVCQWTVNLTAGESTGDMVAPKFTSDGAAVYRREYSLPFDVPADRLPSLDRFPCAAEAARLAWWFDRPELAPRGPDAEKLVGEALADLQFKNPIECFAQIQAALGVLDVDWRADHPPPDASCAADLALATTYYDGVFDDRLRGQTRLAHEVAEVAGESRSAQGCLVAAATVRRAYLADLGAPHANATLDVAAITAGLPFTPRAERLPLLYRFPCQEEAQRLAWWFDRPNLAPRSDEATPLVVRALTDLRWKNPVQCFSDIDVALRAVDLDWSAAHPAPVAPCEIDLELADAYVEAMRDASLSERVATMLERARAAKVRDDPAACLMATAEVRRAYVEALHSQ